MANYYALMFRIWGRLSTPLLGSMGTFGTFGIQHEVLRRRILEPCRFLCRFFTHPEVVEELIEGLTQYSKVQSSKPGSRARAS